MTDEPVYRTIRELAGDDRPRERLLTHGPEVLSDTELLAILLGSGLQGTNVLDLSRMLLEQASGLPGLARLDTKALQRLKGLGPAKATQIAAAIEIARRLKDTIPEARPQLLTPDAVHAFIGGRLMGKTREELHVLALNTKGRLLGQGVASRGGVSAAAVRPAEVFREAIVLDATSVIVVHNHPSGDPKPSPQDVEVTRELVEAGRLLGIDVLDHVVIGQNRYVSMRRDGLGFTSR